jgi:hypothetical protein
MNLSFLDDDSPTQPARDWSADPLPPEMRTYRAVLTDACPTFDGRHYHWWPAPGEWSGVNPPYGSLPLPLYVEMVRLMRFVHYETKAGAMVALETVVLRHERGLRPESG